MTNEITADGEWAYQVSPKVKVQVAIVGDGPHYGVVSMAQFRPLAHNKGGHCLDIEASSPDDYNLVPLQKARECWVVFHANGALRICQDAVKAETSMERHGGKIVHVVEPE